MGMSFPGELKRLAAIALPDVAIETRVTPAHLLNFSSIEDIALAKRELIEGLHGAASVAVLNADDARVAAMAEAAPGRVIFYGVEKPAEFFAEAIEDRGALGSSFTLVHRGKRTRMELPLPGRHVVSNALAAIAAASVWNVGVAEAQSVFRGLRTPAMRGELIRFTNGFALINDSYNSSPAALHAMISLLAATPGYQRRILAAGEMRELGTSSANLHREAGEYAAKAGKIDYVIGVQGDAAEIVEGAVAAGVPRERTKFFLAPSEAAAFLAESVLPGDLLLVKGSRSVKMERIVEVLLGRFAPVDVPSSAGTGH
jgi:UDP-N-acetylmuramoyl-tripeptide--D-alanyl-D-alanine ligase